MTTATMQQGQSGLWLPQDVALPAKRRPGAVSAYRWGKMSLGEQKAALDGGWLPPMAGGAARTYAAWNGTQPTTAALVKVTTGTAIKTLMQVQPGASVGLRVIEWGISFDATAATPIQCELIDTAAINATVTTYASTDIVKMNGPNDAASTITLGTAASGFTGSAEGTITSGRLGDYQLVAQSYVKQFPLGREFELAVSKNLRVRVTAAVAVNAITYIVWEE